MKSISFLVLILIFTNLFSQSQNVGAGTISPNTSAMLDGASTDKGLLIPRMDSNQRANITSPETGLLVYQTTGQKPGFYCYTSTSWVNLQNQNSGWSTTGNADTNIDSNCIGTTDAVDLKIKVNNQLAGMIQRNAGVSVPTTSFGYQTFSQSIVAEIKYVFIDDENSGKYSGGIRVDEGTIKVGDVLKPKDENGSEYTFKVISLEDNDLNASVKSLSAGKDGFVVLQTPDKKKVQQNPTGSLFFGNNKKKSAEMPMSETGTTCIMNGASWKGVNYYKSSSFFPKGNSLVNTTQPYLIISFKSGQNPDDRQFTFIHKDSKVGLGILNKKNFELVISGSEDGIPDNSCLVSNWKNGEANTQKTDFYFEITRFEDKGDHIILSAKYSGKLYGLNLFKGLTGASCKDITIKNGEINNLKIDKY
jgi:hypothetical protein